MQAARTYWEDFRANARALLRSASTWFVNVISAFIAWAGIDYAPLPEPARVFMRQAVDAAFTGVFTQYPVLSVGACVLIFWVLRAHPQGGLTK